jgi:hypothetical protein
LVNFPVAVSSGSASSQGQAAVDGGEAQTDRRLTMLQLILAILFQLGDGVVDAADYLVWRKS